MEDQDRWPYGKPPVAGTVQGAPLSPRQIAEVLEYRDLFNKQQEQLKEEGRKTDQGLEWRIQVNSDFSDMSAEHRAEVEGEIAELRSDPEVRASLRRRLEESKPELLRLMDESE